MINTDNSSKTKKIVLYILLPGALILVGYGVYIAYMNALRSTNSARAVSIHFLALLQSHSFDKANALFTAEAQQITPPEKMMKIQAAVESIHGRILGYKILAGRYQATPGATGLALHYAVQYQGSKGTVDTFLVSEPDGWKVLAYNFSS